MAKELTAREMQSMGGKARAKKLSPEQRSASAKKAAEARWKRLEDTLDRIEEGTKRLKKAMKQKKVSTTKS